MTAYPGSYADLDLLIYNIYLFTCLLVFILKAVSLIISALHR